MKARPEKQQAANEFQDQHKEKMKEVSLALAEKRSGMTKKNRVSHQVVRVPLPEGVPEQKHAKALIPPDSTVWRSTKDNGWCGHVLPYSRSHYSGVLYGTKESFVYNLRDMWTKYLTKHGLPESECKVLGLFSDEWQLPRGEATDE